MSKPETRSALEQPVGRQEPGRDDWRRLKPYGYAPGDYMKTCQRCGDVAHDVDKYARCCRSCAEAMHDTA